MTGEESAPSKPTRRAWRVGAIMAVVLLAPTFCTWAWVEWQLASELNRCRAAGEPITVAELQAEYERQPIDAERTQEWLELHKRFGDPSFNHDHALPLLSTWIPMTQTWNDPPPGEWREQEWTVNQVDGAKQIIGKHQAVFDDVRRLSQNIEGVRFPHDFTEGLIVDLPHLKAFSTMKHCLEIIAEVDAADGKPVESANAVNGLFNCADVLFREGSLSPCLIGQTTLSVACKQIHRRIESRLVDDATCRQWQERLSRVDNLANIGRCLVTERAECDDAIQRDLAMTLMLAKVWWRTAERLYLLDFEREPIAASKVSWARLLHTVDEQEVQLDLLRKGWMKPPIRPCSLLTVVQPATFLAIRRLAEAQQRFSTTMVVLAIERYRLRNGSLPTALSELSPEFIDTLPIDIFTGEPLKYRKEDDAWIVYGRPDVDEDYGGVLREDVEQTSMACFHDIGVRIKRKQD